MNKALTYLLLAALSVSCVSIDARKAVKTASGIGKQERAGGEPVIIAVPVDTEPEPQIIEKPVYVPQAAAQGNPPKGRTAVEQSNREGTVQPQDYSHAAMIYDYHPDFVYEIYCRPYRITDIRLRPGEKAVDTPFVSDSERWMLGAGVSYEGATAIQHIYVKPTAASLEAALIINTNERVYHVILRSFSNVHMPMVRWKYLETHLPQNYAAGGTALAVPGTAAGTGTEEGDGSTLADPRFLSFNYRITYGLFKKPRWLPTLAYDDGKKTYVTFPDAVLQAELPAVFENRADIVNYRVARNVMIIDKLIETVTVRIGDRSVTVTKRRGK